MTAPYRFGILGGTFNPPHIAHLRLGVEVLERLELQRLDLLPCHQPPHKCREVLLPFSLRVHCLNLALGLQGRGESALPPVQGVRINTMEQNRPGPSYTVDTLTAYREMEPDGHPHFIMGANDLLTLDTWKQGLELPSLAALVVVPRESVDLENVRAYIGKHWFGAREVPPPGEATAAWSLPHKGRKQGADIIYLPLPYLEISGERVRKAWVEGRCLRGMVPEAVERELLQQEELVNSLWGVRKK